MISDAQFKSSALAGAVFGCLAYYTQRLRLRYSVTSTRRAREVSHWEYMWAKHAQWAGQVLSSLLPLAAWCAAVVVPVAVAGAVVPDLSDLGGWVIVVKAYPISLLGGLLLAFGVAALSVGQRRTTSSAQANEDLELANTKVAVAALIAGALFVGVTLLAFLAADLGTVWYTILLVVILFIDGSIFGCLTMGT